jgi:hypothetical protein
MWLDWIWTGKEKNKTTSRHHTFFLSIVYFQYLLLINLFFVLLHLLSCLVYAYTFCGTFDVHSRRTSSLEIISSVLIELFVHILSLYHVTSMTAGINFGWEWCDVYTYVHTHAYYYRKLTKKKENERVGICFDYMSSSQSKRLYGLFSIITRTSSITFTYLYIYALM